MTSFRKVIAIASSSYKEWLFDYRRVLSLMVICLLSFCVTLPLAEVSRIVDVPLNVLEPFIAMVNSSILIGIILCVFLFLISDFPRLEGNNGYMLIRSGRLIWLWGKLAFSIFAILTFIAILFTVLTLPALADGFLVNSWSYVVKDFMEKYFDLASEKNYFAQVTENVFNHFKPYTALFHSCMLMGCTAFVFTLIMMIFNFLNKKIAGVIVNISGVIIGIALMNAYQKSKFVFPVANGMIAPHNTDLHNIYPIGHSYIYFGVLILILLIINIILCKKVAIQKDGER